MDLYEQLINLLSNENRLLENGINGYSEIFLIENILILIEKKATISPDCFMYYLESYILLIYKQIKDDPRYTIYTDQIKDILEVVPITENSIDSLKNIFKEMHKKCSLTYAPEIIIKFLI